MKVYFDVGANNGSWGISKIHSEPDCVVYAFEPNPKFKAKLESVANHYPNYKFYPYAVFNVSTSITFNIADGTDGSTDSGCSSILNFRKEMPSCWANRPDMIKTQEIVVDSITMKDFCSENNITRIDFFHCDVQGVDLQVLESFEDLYNIIQAGQIECATNPNVTIYENQTSNRETCTQWLLSHGFKINQIINEFCGECDLVFSK